MKTIAIQKLRCSLPGSQAGLSLVELMVSLTIGLILLAGITALIVQQSITRDELEKSSRQIENGRYAMQLLHDDLQLAGYYGEYAPPAGGIGYTTPDPCEDDEDELGWDAAAASVPVPIFGYAGAAGDPVGCLNHYRPNTAVLVVHRAATDTVLAAAPVAGTAYLQASRCNAEATPFLFGTTATTTFNLRQMDCATLSLLRAYIVRIYYVSDCDRVVGGNCADTIPTLKVVEFMNGATTTRPLVEGIENLQFDYGVDTTGDGSPDSYTTAATLTTPANWANVMAVRVNLLARNNDPTQGYQDTKTYDLGLAASAVAPGGTFKRHVYSELVRAVNPSGRRERP